MPKNQQTVVARKTAGGRRTVTYVGSRGREYPAEVIGGTFPNLNLRVRGLVPRGARAGELKTAVAKRTAMNQTNVWYTAF